MSASLSIPQKLYSWIYFSLLLIVCLVLYKDYGISWDEPAQRLLGIDSYEYVHGGDKNYLESRDRVYGVGFEMPLIYLEKLMNLKDTRDIFLLRHFSYFFFFSFACFLFFRLNLKLFKKT